MDFRREEWIWSGALFGTTDDDPKCGGFHSHGTPIAGWFMNHGKSENTMDDLL